MGKVQQGTKTGAMFGPSVLPCVCLAVKWSHSEHLGYGGEIQGMAWCRRGAQ